MPVMPYHAISSMMKDIINIINNAHISAGEKYESLRNTSILVSICSPCYCILAHARPHDGHASRLFGAFQRSPIYHRLAIMFIFIVSQSDTIEAAQVIMLAATVIREVAALSWRCHLKADALLTVYSAATMYDA